MSIFSNLFKKASAKDKKTAAQPPAPNVPNEQSIKDSMDLLDMINKRLSVKIEDKESRTRALTEQELQVIFVEYFAKNTEFYTQPGTAKHQAYFGAINAATAEMLNNPQLFAQATKRDPGELQEIIDAKKPLSSVLIAALIFCVGEYAVVKDAMYCVDFSEMIPNCIALYLLLIAQKQPKDNRKQAIDAGNGTDVRPLTNAVNALSVCDPDWVCKILSA